MKKVILGSIIAISLITTGFGLDLGIESCSSLAMAQSSYCNLL